MQNEGLYRDGGILGPQVCAWAIGHSLRYGTNSAWGRWRHFILIYEFGALYDRRTRVSRATRGISREVGVSDDSPPRAPDVT